jgi:hypothetical protein
MNQWMKQLGTQQDMDTPRAMSVSRAGVATPASQPINQVAETSPTAGALLAPANFIANTELAL